MNKISIGYWSDSVWVKLPNFQKTFSADVNEAAELCEMFKNVLEHLELEVNDVEECY